MSDPKKARASKKAQAWAKHIRLWERSSLTQVAYCKKHGLSCQQFYWWRKRLKEPGRPSRRPKSTVGQFIPVQVTPTTGAWAIEIEAVDGTKVRMQQIAPSTLEQLVRPGDRSTPKCG